ncbi:MAG: uroporphyrinogen-III synthase, partial [Candidatus Sericytochromatia bacterium]
MTLPLKNRRILVTRAAEQAGALEARLRELGAEVLVAPAIAIRPPAGWEAVDQAIDSLPETDWVAFTSPNGVRFFLDRLLARGRPWPEGPRVAAVGPGTAEPIEARGLKVELTPARFDGVALAEALLAQGPLA